MMWPLTSDANPVWLALYLLTFAVHVVLVGYVVAGTAYALIAAIRGKDDAIADGVRDRLPFMLGLGITAGVAPLLFLQLLYQRQFYSANLIAGPRWGAVVPALIMGFYALYLAKATIVPRLRKLALAAGLVCFVFVAWSWTELNALLQDEPAWREMYAAGARFYGDSSVAPRLLVWLGAMATSFAILAAWWVAGEHRRRLALIGLCGRIVSAIAVAILSLTGASVLGAAHGWAFVLIAALVVEGAGWIWMLRAPASGALSLVTGAGAAALLAGVIVREAPRLLLIERPRDSALDAQGMWVFVTTALLGVVLIGWIIRTIRRA
ncbi:MAG: hypothetical protein ACKV2T_12260 [Kofleriaceae bacterium]